MDEDGRIMLLSMAKVDRLMRERSEREKAAQAALLLLLPPPPPPPSTVFSPQLHKKL